METGNSGTEGIYVGPDKTPEQRAERRRLFLESVGSQTLNVSTVFEEELYLVGTALFLHPRHQREFPKQLAEIRYHNQMTTRVASAVVLVDYATYHLQPSRKRLLGK